MPKRKPFNSDVKEIEKAMAECKSKSEYRRIQCVHLAMLHPGMAANKIAEITLFSESRVWAIHAIFRKEGLAGLIDSRGGRHRENLTLAEEAELLKPFEQESKNGSLIVAGRVKNAYEQKIGREAAESTIYRMLNRHGFRKITPYRRHIANDIHNRDYLQAKRLTLRRSAAFGTHGFM